MAAVVGIVASLLGPAIEIGKCFQKQLSYLCCFQTNVKALADAAKDLEDAQADLQVRVDEAKRNGELISNQVETWLAKANDTHDQVIALGIGTTQKPRIYNLKSRYSLGRKAKKTANSMKELRDTCKFDHVSSRALPASMGQLAHPLRPTPGIESRNKTEDDIIRAMRDEEVHVIGVCGMGGVGKTTMAKQIMKRAKEDEGIFDEALLVAVGQQADMLKIQHGIADWLGLKLKEETLAPRAIRLRDRLQSGKRKLIIIDDVWDRINLEELGIPCESRLCTILLTSRDRGVLHQMNAQRVFTVQILSDEEAWSMFKENVGACLDDSNLLPIASEVAKECKGLPLALIVVSRALKDKVSKGIWSDALKQLKSSNPMDIKDVIKDVYNPITLSYDFLESQHAKSLLFLCSSFPEDHEISLEYLAFYGLGLCIFTDINNLEEARNRITGLVDMLKSRFLILHGKDERYVKMHDVVRDVAIFIASKEKHAILEFTSLDWSNQILHNDCNTLSVSQKRQFDFPMGFTFPMLSFLWMNMLGFELPSMSDNFFKGMQQLKVVSISCVSFGLSPQNMRLLKNLRTLHLYGCNLKTLSPVGELSSLEILCCHSCDVIKELPAEIGRLERLRLLEFTNCPSLKIIVPGVISRLGQLEELKILYGFKGWESQEIENERRNASLAELLSLSKLTCLEIEIKDWSLHSQVLQLSSNIVKYNIKVGEKSSKWEPPWINTTHEKKLSVSLKMSTSLRNWIDAFASTAEYLCFEGADTNGFNFSRNQNMRCLIFKNCQTVVKLASSASTGRGFDVFPVLEDLYLCNLPKLEEIFDGPIPDGSSSFAKLKKIHLSYLNRLMHVWMSKTQDVLLNNLYSLGISYCGKLRRVFLSSVVIRSLSQLLILEIKYCESMEEVFWIEFDHGNSRRITFPKLKKLSLANLGCLTDFCKGIDRIEFPQLVWLEILHCPKLTSFGNAASDGNHVNSSVFDDSVHIFCNTKITFGSLKSLDIGGYNNISYLWCHHIPNTFFGQLEELSVSHICDIANLFSYSVAANLVNLKNLTIVGCDEMAHVIADESIAQKPQIKFHKLERLELFNLRSLEAFCKGIHGINIEFHRPIELIIVDCPKLTGVINMIQSDQNDHLNSSSTHHPSLHLICYTKSTFGSLHHFFSNLEALIIEECVNMNNLFSYSVAANLVNLKKLCIESCNKMVHVVAEDDAESSETKPPLVIIFPKLKELVIADLPKLHSICEGGWDLQLPSLQRRSLSTPNFDFIHLSSITEITFGSCAHNYLFSHSMAGNFVNLETLNIYECSEMVYVIADDDDDVARTSHEIKPHTIFHKLKRLELESLPKLQSLCDCGWDVQFPLLERLIINSCPGMKGHVTPESIRKQNMDAVQNRLARERSGRLS